MAIPNSVSDVLRQMLALLENERQALAGLDLERILTCASGKENLCAKLEAHISSPLDEESEGLLNSVRRMNAINRKLRNMVAANMTARLNALTGSDLLYAPVQTNKSA